MSEAMAVPRTGDAGTSRTRRDDDIVDADFEDLDDDTSVGLSTADRHPEDDSKGPVRGHPGPAGFFDA